MKFSVLLPTYNRLDLLKIALHSILSQGFDDWEVIVSDNFSGEDILEYISSLHEPRIKYFRTERFVSVTENWNFALEKSSGEYIIMLGDDDCLMKEYFRSVFELLERFSNPDFIYTSGFLYAYPAVMPWCQKGFLNVFGNASFLESQREPFWLSKSKALEMVKGSMNFKVMFAYNMQYAIISKGLVEKLAYKGSFFQTSYPDYYAMTAMMLKADRILACPMPLVAVGISPKSFGFYYFNKKEREGGAFLNNAIAENERIRMQKILISGSEMNTFWLLSMDALRENFKDEAALDVNYTRYRFLQIVKSYRNFAAEKGEESIDKIKTLWVQMTRKEKLCFGIPFCVLSVLLLGVPKRLRHKILNRLESLTGSHPSFKSMKIPGDFLSMRDVFEQIDPCLYQ